MSAGKVQVHYVASTHWDREWYFPFQGFRYLLVKLVDQLIELLEKDSGYRYFVFDGQTVALSDYLEVRPENRDRLARLIKSGRILVGPWYTMPDERLVSGEALIRNIMRGYADAAGWGVKPMRYGYICDIFGHIAQMPQIFAGMGIGHALLGRGTNEHTHPAHFIWRSPDGTGVVAFKEQDSGGYGAGRGLWAAAGGESGAGVNRDRVIEEAKKLFEKEASRSDVPVQLWLDGVDHQRPGPGIPEALEIARRALPDADIVFSTLPAFAKAVDRFRAKLPVFEGELIDVARAEGGYIFLISHCMSSHYPMKLANDRCQNALERWAEPFHVWADLLGKAPAAGYLGVAWQYLLQNHPHDSICGCSIDQVHKDTEYRYDQCALIAREVINDCHGALAPAADRDAKALTLTVANAVPFADTRVVTVDFAYPADFARRGLTGFSDDRIPCFDLVDAAGRRVDYQLHRYIASEEYLGLPAWGQEVQRTMHIRMFCEASFDGISARNLTVVPCEKRHRDMGTQMTGALSAANEHLAVEVNADGTLNLTDKASGRRFENLCIFEDTGDMGDGWYHVKPVHNETFFSTGFPTSISVVDDGSLVTTFRIEKTLMLPAEHDWALMRRGEEKRPVTLRMDVILRKGARHVECVATLDNTVKDHRLRVLFTSRVAGEDYFANQPFAFVSRKRGVDKSTADWKENDTEERNFHGIAGVADAKGGLAIVAGEGLHEIAVKDDAEATMAMTLMRAFKRTVLPPYTGRSELQQWMTFAWRLVPFAGKPDFAALTNLQMEFQSGVRVCETRGQGPEAGTFARLKRGRAILSALKPGANGRSVIVRLYNPTAKPVSDALVFSTPFSSAVEVNYAEEPMRGAKAAAAGNTLKVDLPPFRIRTWRLRFRTA